MKNLTKKILNVSFPKEGFFSGDAWMQMDHIMNGVPTPPYMSVIEELYCKLI